MIIKGQFSEEIKAIYESSDKHFISEQSNDNAINGENMAAYVYRDDETHEILGYLCVYEKADFLNEEEFDVEVKGIRPESVYIWEIGTKKGHEGKGIATALLKYIRQKYRKYDIYSCVEMDNEASMALHDKFGFKVVASFEEDFFGRGDEQYLILKKTSQRKNYSRA